MARTLATRASRALFAPRSCRPPPHCTSHSRRQSIRATLLQGKGGLAGGDSKETVGPDCLAGAGIIGARTAWEKDHLDILQFHLP
ncbi:hypothetical protein NDU88_002548 [Pleurodeles waltl]|uniref:Uncharacterized protein n=1 Tax=Pleurodeles waltl TaxID=8319 RepID=A0AAV7QD88_PLEWA|nr:hypothetical protein NDU88_002548 [Pleurodeles waltl]